jgi:dTDP-4-amino-4,6-dideoxygalactose transaminase
MGPCTERLEQTLCSLTGATYAVALSSCTAALHLGMLACGIKAGDEVLCPSLTFVATANAIRYVGAQPVFCESVSPANLNIDVGDAEARITARTRGIAVVHYAGYPVDMPRIMDLARAHNLVVIEDCAHACVSSVAGRYCGTWGDCGCFSFFSNKNATCGEGGAVITNNFDLAARLRLLRSHGMTSLTLDRHRGRASSYDVVTLGYNFRIDEIRASLLLSQLDRLTSMLADRKRVVVRYRSRLEGSAISIPHFDWAHVARNGGEVAHHIMPVLLPSGTDRTAVMATLQRAGIQSSIHYPPVHCFTSYAGHGRLPKTEHIAARQLTLPLFPRLTDVQVDDVCDTLINALRQES